MFWHFLCGLVVASFLEWFVHKYFLHKMGKKKASLFSFHWGVHHRRARKNSFLDKEVSPRELVGVFALCLLMSPVLYVSPVMYTGMFFHAMIYLVIHNYAHKNPDWSRKYLKWHYDHHMGKDQDKNWCVVHPLADYVLKTRKKDESR